MVEPATKTCPVCGRLYSVTGDRQHLAFHYKFVETCLRVGYFPEAHAQREERKAFGDSLMQHSSDTRDKIYGAMQVLKAYFDRSFCNAIANDYATQHPKFNEYAPMVIEGVCQRWPDEEARKVLRRRFGSGRTQVLPTTYWSPARG
jgi:hypothetical protein